MLLALLLAAATAAAPAAAPWRAPRTADGRPDLQGEWTNFTYTPLQRPKRFASLTVTEAEAKAMVMEALDRQAGKAPAPKPGDPPPEPTVGDVESEWYEGRPELLRLDGAFRSSLIVAPSDGRLPYNAVGLHMQADALRRDEELMDGPEDRIGDERCLIALGSAVGPPMLSPPYNAHYRIVQTPQVIAIHSEMIHDVRLVRMDARHDAVAARWAGDSIGRWEGDTLVVETVGQHPASAERFVGPGVFLITPGARVTERFTRTGPAEIRYAFEVEDAAIYTRPWRGELRFASTAEPMFEYACHEGNHALPNILAGARRKEADLKASKPAAAKAKAD